MKLHHRLMSGKHILAIKQRCERRFSTLQPGISYKSHESRAGVPFSKHQASVYAKQKKARGGLSLLCCRDIYIM